MKKDAVIAIVIIAIVLAVTYGLAVIKPDLKPLVSKPYSTAAVGETTHPKIKRLSRPPVDADWLTGSLRELELLADEGDTLEVVAKLGAIVREPLREVRVSPVARPHSEASPRTADEPSASA